MNPLLYVVESYASNEAPSERRHLKHGEFSFPAEALVCAQRVIDDDLLDSITQGNTAAEALDLWKLYGEVPMIFGPTRVEFHPFDYAERRAAELGNADAGKKGDQPSEG